MALIFSGADADKVNFGSGTTLDNVNTFTYLMWLYRTGTNTTDVATLVTKGSFPDSRHELSVSDIDGTSMLVVVDRATTDAAATASTAIDLNAWNFIGATFSATNGPKIFKGSLTSLLAEVAYSSGPTTGAGAVGDDSATNLEVGGRSGSTTGSMPARIAWVGIWNVEMTLAQMQTQQFRPHVTSGCVLFSHLGFNGTGTQPDWSGNGNSGTVIDATLGDHIPLMAPWGLITEWLGAFAAAGGAGVRLKRMALFGMG